MTVKWNGEDFNCIEWIKRNGENLIDWMYWMYWNDLTVLNWMIKLNDWIEMKWIEWLNELNVLNELTEMGIKSNILSITLNYMIFH